MIKKILGRIKQIALNLSPLFVLKRVLPWNPIGVFYHAVSDAPMPHVEHLYPPITSKQFENALLYLKQQYTPVNYQQLHQHVLEGKPLPTNAVHLSFDDGFAECYSVVLPLLQKHQIPCTFFVTSGWVDNHSMFYRNKVSLAITQVRALDEDSRRMIFTALNNALDTRLKTVGDFERWVMPLVQADEHRIDMACRMLGISAAEYLAEHPLYLTSAQILEMHKAGFTIGSHTQNHPKLSQVDEETMEMEIIESSRFVQSITGQAVVPFSFPNSGNGLDRAVLAQIREKHDFLGLFFDTQGITQDVPFNLHRIWAEHRDFAHRNAQTNLPQVIKAAYRKAI